MATFDWKNRLKINPEFTLFLCCADEAVFKSSNAAAIVPPTPPTLPGQPTPTPPPFFQPPLSSEEPPRTDYFFSTTPFTLLSTNLYENENYILTTGPNNNGTTFIGQQPPHIPRPAGTRPFKNPVLSPQAQIMLPGNGNRVVDGPQIIQLVVGEINQSGQDGMYKYSGSVSLIQDSGLNILVDSGSAQNRNKLLAGKGIH
jgi:hypothetical protein